MSNNRRRSGGFLSRFSRSQKRQQTRRRLLTEQLENRVLLAADVMPMTNEAFIYDVDRNGELTGRDALVIINELNGAGAEAEQRFATDVNGDHLTTGIDALMVINALNRPEGEGAATFMISSRTLDANVGILDGTFTSTRPNIIDFDGTGANPPAQNLSSGDQLFVAESGSGSREYTVQSSEFLDPAPGFVDPFFRVTLDRNLATTENGTLQVAKIIDRIGTNSDFLLGIFAEDLEFGGPFGVYTDITFDDALAGASLTTSDGSPNFVTGFANGKVGNTSTTGLVDDAGSFGSDLPTGGGQHLIFTVDMTSLNQTGSLTFNLDPSDVVPATSILAHTSNDPICHAGETDPDCVGMVMYTGTTISISSDITAVDDTASIDQDATQPVFINVLANDSITVGTGPTLANPIPTSSTNGGTVAQSGSDGFNYTPPSGFSGPDTFQYTITNGSTTASATVTVTVIPDTPAPVISAPNNRSLAEDTDFRFTAISVSDPDSASVTVTLGVTNGTLTPNSSSASVTGGGSGSVSMSGSVQNINAALNGLTYSPNDDFNGADTLQIGASDGVGSDSHTVNLTITPVNDAPVNTVPGPQSLFNTQTLSFTSNQFQVSDVDASTLEVTLQVTQGTIGIGSTSGVTVQNNNSTSLTATGSISNLNTALNSLLYDPIDTFTGTDTLTMTTSDLGNTGAGGTLTDTDTVSLEVTPPQLPFATSNSYSADEGTGAFTLSPDPLSDDKMDDGATLSLKGSIVPGGSNQGGGSVSFDSTSGSFTYTPGADPDFFGTETFTYTIEQDAAHTPSSTGDSESTGTITIDIQPVNDGPVNTVPSSASVDEDEMLAFSGLSISDIDAGSGGVTVTLTVNSGTLNVSNTSGVQGNGSGNVTIDGTVSQVNSTLGGLTYMPELHFNGNDSLTINTNDNGNTGGTALSDSDTVNITIAPINDAPVLVVPGQQSFITDFDNLFASGSDAISISDVDAGSDDVQVDLTIGDGALTLSSTSGVSVTGDGTGAIRITGSVTNINSALGSGLRYNSNTPTPTGTTRPLGVSVSDLGNNGGGPTGTASDTIDIEVLDFVPVDIIGQVFIDTDGDNEQDSNEPGIEGVDVILSGIDFQGNTVNFTDTTNATGKYEFLQLRPNQPGNPYTITQEQPVFIQNNQGGNTMDLTIDQRGNASLSGGSSNFGEGGFAPGFEDAFPHFGHLQGEPYSSGILFGVQPGVQDWSMFFGSEWDVSRYSNARLSLSSDGESAVLTVYDSVSETDRTANISTKDATLASRGSGSDRIYRVIGGSSLLGQATAGGEGEGKNAISMFGHAVDAVFAGN